MLCAVDVDGDGVTDVLLVGAPMYMNDRKKEEGRVYLFTITKVTKPLHWLYTVGEQELICIFAFTQGESIITE